MSSFVDITVIMTRRQPLATLVFSAMPFGWFVAGCDLLPVLRVGMKESV